MKYAKVIVAVLIATAAMTAFMLIAPLIGLPKMNMGELLGALLWDSKVLGWIAHVVMGIVFAFIYTTRFNQWIPVINYTLRGLLYGIVIYIMSQIVFTTINLLGEYTYDMKENMALASFGYMLAGMIYGATLGTIVKGQKITKAVFPSY